MADYSRTTRARCWHLAVLLIGICSFLPDRARAENVALTFDDLPLNGTLQPGMTQARITKDVLSILKKIVATPQGAVTQPMDNQE